MGSLFEGKYSQWANTFLPITETYLEPSQKSTMKHICKKIEKKKPLTIFAKSSIVDFNWILNTPLNYLLAKST